MVENPYIRAGIALLELIRLCYLIPVPKTKRSTQPENEEGEKPEVQGQRGG